MSYLVLARKYRSTGFDDVVGQEHVAQTLKRAIQSDRIAHAFLFCGTRGVGKTSMARILAKALNCESAKKPTDQPCGKCNSCVAIARGDDIDVIEIDAASNTGVDNVRDLISNAQFHPARSRFKVYIIDEVHMLSKSAFNALLKTLEEPPPHVKFILATTEPEKILPTILSRCQRYDFRNIPTRVIAQHLADICKKEKIKADEAALLLLAKAGAGSMRDALSLLDRMLSVGEKNLTCEMIEQLLGMPRSQSLFDLTQAIGAGDTRRALELADAQIRGGMSPDTLVAGLIEHLRNLLILRTCGPESQLVEVPGLSPGELAQQAQRFEPATLSQDIAILEELRRNLRTSQAGRALLDATLVRLALAEQFTPLEQLLASVNNGGGGGTSGARPALKKNADPLTPSPCTQGEGSGVGAFASQSQLASRNSQVEPPAESNVAPVAATDLDGIWQTLLQLLSAKRVGLPQMLAGAKLVGIEDGTAIIRFAHDDENLMRMFDRNGKRETIRDLLTSLLKQSVGVKFELEPKPRESEELDATTAEPVAATAVRRSPVPRAAAASPESSPSRLTPELKQQLASDPLIAAVIEHLGGEIVKVE
jgi:DNA polymerase-3 subunit gamma/tau